MNDRLRAVSRRSFLSQVIGGLGLGAIATVTGFGLAEPALAQDRDPSDPVGSASPAAPSEPSGAERPSRGFTLARPERSTARRTGARRRPAPAQSPLPGSGRRLRRKPEGLRPRRTGMTNQDARDRPGFGRTSYRDNDPVDPDFYGVRREQCRTGFHRDIDRDPSDPVGPCLPSR